MAGFFQAMKRIIQGKPVFDTHDPRDGYAPSTQPSHTPQAPTAPAQKLVQKGNARTFPVVYVKRTITRQNGPNQQVSVRILNTFPQEIELDKIRLMNTSRDLKTKLRPNEEREFMVFQGPRLPREQYREALLDYKTIDGDYFESIHDVEFQYESDKTYSVEELHLKMPIRDIYG